MNTFLAKVLLTLNVNSVFRHPNISLKANETLNNLAETNQTIISIPFYEQRNILTKLSDLPEQPCNQQTFFRHLCTNNHWNKQLYRPNFLLKPFFQTPEKRCFVTTRSRIDLAVQNQLLHRRKSEIPNSVLQFYHPLLKRTEYKIAGWENHPPRIISSLHNADAVTFMFHVISSFFERHEILRFQLFSAPLPHPKFIQNQYCHVKLNLLPRINHVQYATKATHLIDQANIHECDLDQMISINRRPQNIYLIGFSGENFLPIVPLNAKNDRVYFQRYTSEISNALTNESSPWLILKVQLGIKLRAEPNNVFILPWKHSHILDHKYLFTPKALRPHYLTSVFSFPDGILFNHNQESSPHTVNFPMKVRQQSTNNINWTSYLHSRCDAAALNNIIYPYGSLEILLLKTTPPIKTSEMCQVLPDVINPRKSYAELQLKIAQSDTKSKLIFYTWTNPAIYKHNLLLTNQNYQQKLNKPYTEYDKFSKETFKTLQKLQRFRMAKHFDQFRLNLLKHTLHNSEDSLVTNAISQSINATLKTKVAHVQLTKTLANKLWRIHLIRQKLLHKAYVTTHVLKFVKNIIHNTHFQINEIYEHHLRGNKVQSRSRFKIVNDSALQIQNTDAIPHKLPLLHPLLRQIISLFNHAIQTSVKLISDFRNYFSTSQYSSNNHLLAQISLRQLNAKT